MNILVHSPAFPPATGGIEVFVMTICDQLHQRGHRVCVLTKRWPGGCQIDREQAFPVFRYPTLRRPGSLFPTCAALLHARRWRADIILVGMFMSTHALGALLSRRLFGIPYAILVHGNEARDLFAGSRTDRWVSSHILGGASLVLANSQRTRKDIIRLGSMGNRTVVIHPGVDTHKFHPRLDGSDLRCKLGIDSRPVILSASRLVPKKNHKTTLRAIAQVISQIPDLMYLIVGTGPEENRLRRLVERLHLEEHVIFVGNVSHRDVPSYYAACEMFVMPSRTVKGDVETFGIVFAEASACGKPVIGGRSGGIYDAVEDGVTGLLVDPTDEGALAAAIIRILKDKSFAESLGQAGRLRAEKALSLDVMGRRVEELLTTTIEKHKQGLDLNRK